MKSERLKAVIAKTKLCRTPMHNEQEKLPPTAQILNELKGIKMIENINEIVEKILPSYQCGGLDRLYLEGAIKSGALVTKQEFDEVISLLDGAYTIIEIWKAESPAQIEWKKNWIESSRKIFSAIRNQEVKP